MNALFMIALLTTPLWIGALHLLWYWARDKPDQTGDPIPVLKIVERRLKKIDDDVAELEKWNTEWVHPELGSFYYWDSSERKYLESSANVRARGNCVSCGVPAHVRDRSTGYVSFCYPCFSTSRYNKSNFGLVDPDSWKD